jgi:tetratricopeptide (TPR) repeat protein
MKQISRILLLSSCATAIGGASVLALAKGSLTEHFEFRRAVEQGAAASLPDSRWGETSICHSPGTRTTSAMIRLAQTEVQPGVLQAVQSAPEFADSEPPLWEGLGSITYKITTTNADAQSFFDQGMRLTYAFNHDEARRAFRKAQRLDPDCAMCFWGEALVLGPNINLPMQEEAVPLAFAAMQKAQALAAKARPHEQALIAALSKRYAEKPTADRTALDAAYAAAMAEVTAKFPDDNEIAILYAESVMDLSPWNYWQPGGAEPNPQSVTIVPTLERVLARDPNHPGAIHYYIHAVEASDRPQRAEPYAERLRGAIPNGGHLVHMPSHIYYRVGRYLDALKDNKVAAAVDETYLAITRAPMGVYRLGYYPHNVHFVLAAAQMAGDGPTVIASAEKLRAIIPDEAARGLAMAHPVKAAAYFAHAQFSSPDTILGSPTPAIAYLMSGRCGICARHRRGCQGQLLWSRR